MSILAGPQDRTIAEVGVSHHVTADIASSSKTGRRQLYTRVLSKSQKIINQIVAEKKLTISDRQAIFHSNDHIAKKKLKLLLGMMWGGVSNKLHLNDSQYRTNRCPRQCSVLKYGLTIVPSSVKYSLIPVQLRTKCIQNRKESLNTLSRRKLSFHWPKYRRLIPSSPNTWLLTPTMKQWRTSHNQSRKGEA